ncbi:LacI family DNA-binding transcriptional regulator [Pseudokineococcus lusitanus]|uniref:LacI family transcriptional regulator n=1 Tax=Pseudokineococcus lusitanus TaxID=763993 RepID=A0A3N1GWH7_9ACTN|nr:LacI family DNA-binding transcriptional regulator [Pseudokineococcus lusitanus]ROP34542.1 LacI family transcriptional regulator [Pseudokineococcus lusitanus]
MPTSKDVARLAGVSQSTVSYVLSGKRPISDPVRRRVEAAIEQLTYHPNAGARALAGSRTHVVGLVVPFGASADPAGLLPFIETITSGTREHDHDVLLVTADEGPSALTRLEGRRLCDAIVLMEVEADDPRIAVAAGLRVPVLLVGVPDDPRGLTCVDLDFAAAARLAVEGLVERGHSHLGVLGYPAGAVERDIGYVRRFTGAALAAAREAGVPCEVVAPVEHTADAAREAVGRVLTAAAPTLAAGGGLGLVVASGGAVPLVLSALGERGLVPGRDVSVVAMLPDASAAAMQPPVSNVSTESRDVSRRAVRELFRLLDGPGEDDDEGGGTTVHLVPPRLTHRRTTATWGPPG